MAPVVSSSEFRGVSARRMQNGIDPFATDLWLDYCDSWATQVGLSRRRDPFTRVTLRRLKHCLKPGRWSLAFKSVASGQLPDFETPTYLAPFVDAVRKVARRQRRCSILDIGGGFGDNYLLVGRALFQSLDTVSYTVVDNPRVTRLGAELYQSCRYPPVFLSKLPASPEKFDFVFLCGTLQYIDENWPAFLSRCQSLASSIYLTRTPITDGEGFYTEQTVFVGGEEAGTCPVRVFGREELMTSLSGCRCILESKIDDYSQPFESLPGNVKAAYYVHQWFS